ncbi:hypothetical protein C0J52_06973 [Blattella germanica]|nr:hypothetical protein C0J52_06973 [Blattella germanica]
MYLILICNIYESWYNTVIWLFGNCCGSFGRTVEQFVRSIPVQMCERVIQHFGARINRCLAFSRWPY